MKRMSIKRNSNRLGKYDAHFLMKLADLLEAGFTMQQALGFLFEQYDILKPHDQKAFITLANDGSSLSSILKAIGYRDAVIIQISFAEIHGEVIRSLRESADYLTHVRETAKKVIKSIQYPLLLVGIFIAILITLNFTVIPQFKSLYTSMGTTSEGVVSILIAVLESLPTALIILTALLLSVVMAVFLVNRLKDAETKCRILLNIPVLNFYFKGFQTYRFSREFGYFISNGLEVKEILELFIHQEINMYLKYISENIERQLMAGDTLSQSIQEIDILEEKLAVFVSHGEHNSNVGSELIMFSEYTLERLIMNVENVTRKIQPVIFVILGFLIICLYLVIVLPIFQMMSSIN